MTSEDIIGQDIREKNSALSERDLGENKTMILLSTKQKAKPVHKHTIVKQRDTSTDTIWGRSTWGTDDWDGTYDNEFETIRVTHPNRKYKDSFNSTLFKDTGSATWNGDGEITFTESAVANSSIVYKNDETITSAKLTAVDSGSVNYGMKCVTDELLPVAHYPLDDNAANTNVIDIVGGNNGTANFNTEDNSITGKINSALEFDGVDDYIELDDQIVCDLEHTTICFWMKRDTANYESILGKGGGCWSLLEVDKYTNMFYFEPDINNRSQTLSSGITIDDGIWHHYAFVFDKTDNHLRIKLYVDGQLKDTDIRNEFTSTFTFDKIGHEENQVTYIYGEYFKGGLDDIRVYNSILDSSEIEKIYNGNGKIFSDVYFEPVTSGVAHTFQNQGEELKWTAYSTGGSISSIEIEY